METAILYNECSLLIILYFYPSKIFNARFTFEHCFSVGSLLLLKGLRMSSTNGNGKLRYNLIYKCTTLPCGRPLFVARSAHNCFYSIRKIFEGIGAYSSRSHEMVKCTCT